MTDIVFSFDTEDYVNDNAADGILRAAKLLRSEGIKGDFNVVGRLAEKLREWQRDDIIEELKHHEINNHSLAHSFHPTVNEYTDVEDFSAALDEFLRQERESERLIESVFGKQAFTAAVAAGTNNSYVAHYGYSFLGSRIYPGDRLGGIPLCDGKTGRPMNCMNIWCADYNESLENLLFSADEESLKNLLEEIKRTKSLYIFVHHPNMAYCTEFWDKLNFDGKNTPESEWVKSPVREESEIEKFYENFALLIKLIKSDSSFRIVNYSDIARNLDGERTIEKDDISLIAREIKEEFFPVTLPDSYCLADIFFAFAAFLKGETGYKCGRVYGFLEEPFINESAVTVTKEEMKESAKSINRGTWLPLFICAGNKKLSMEQWLKAAAEVLDGKETVTVAPGGWQTDTAQFPMLDKMKYKNSWIYTDTFEGSVLERRMKLQTWTFRLPKGTARKIY